VPGPAIDIRKRFGRKWRVTWLAAKAHRKFTRDELLRIMVVEGKYGFISLRMNGCLSVAVPHGAILTLKAIAALFANDIMAVETAPDAVLFRKGWKLYEDSNGVTMWSFPPEDFDAVAEIIGAKRLKPAPTTSKAKPKAKAAYTPR